MEVRSFINVSVVFLSLYYSGLHLFCHVNVLNKLYRSLCFTRALSITATDVYDSSRMFSGFQVGSQNTPNFGHSMLAAPQTQNAAATFIGQSSLEGPAHFHSSFNSEVRIDGLRQA